MTFTAVFMPVPEGYIGFVEEIPGATSMNSPNRAYYFFLLSKSLTVNCQAFS